MNPGGPSQETLPRHLLVVGGTRGIGLSVTRAALEAGYRVTAIGRNRPESSLFPSSGATFHALDLRNTVDIPVSLEQLFDQQGVPDAAVFLQRFRGDEDVWNSELTISLEATQLMLDALGQRMSTDQDHGIVLVSSMAGRFIAPEQPLVYHLAKAGLEQMARYYAVLLGPQGIRVNAVALGSILKAESSAFYHANPELKQTYAEANALKRMGTAEEIAQSILFLCGPAASFVTGQTLLVDGGLSLISHESLARQYSSLRELPITRPTGRITT